MKQSATENVEKRLSTIKKKDKEINAFLYVNPNALDEAKEVDKKLKNGTAGKLAGLTIAVKANISVINMPISCASNTLEGYNGTYDADVIKKIREEDGIIIGITNMDEFACGNSGESSVFGPTNNPAAPGRIPGGSSSGSAAAVAAQMCDLALGTDTGGSIRNPASHCGITGIKPSYGMVSRFGLVDSAMSLDQIGPLASNTAGCTLLLEAISGKNRHDPTTKEGKLSHKKAHAKNLTIGLSPEFEKLCTDHRIYELIKNRAEKFSADSHSVIAKTHLKHVELSVQAYYPLQYVEFYSATRKFDGRRYGKKIEDSCGEEVLRRILGGMEISKAEHHGAYYRKALTAKKLIEQDFEKAFKECDVIILPTTPMLPHKIGTKIEDPKVMYSYDAFTIPANLAGICAAVVQAGQIDGIPVGMQIMAKNENVLIDVMMQNEP